ncbi:uncharacterized protein TNIN_477481 [Trichonephila inaurata madagascariensis]|uniref:Uncharacterized protein n=1 Tax=Trichonephila inaurata madagascariensis TaxID=2747483 RepID=A0A8X7BPN6_9ARAC|nr:uncharacterized protein TNIN_477481 [Trichonephila inaurata madagascariensis]
MNSWIWSNLLVVLLSVIVPFPLNANAEKEKHTYGYHDPSELDDFLPDRSIEDKYSYSPGGFYVPREKKAKLNYFVEEVEFNHNKHAFGSNDESPKDVEAKDLKILTSSEKVGTQVSQRPSFMSFIKNMMLNPKFIAIAMMPLAFFAEMLIPNLFKTFGRHFLPKVSSTIANGFARSFNEHTSIETEQILDLINEFGSRAIEDPKCIKKFICQGAKVQIEGRSGDSWSFEKVVPIVMNSIDEEFLDRYGLKRLLRSIERGNCDSLVCSGSPAYTQDVSFIEKIYLLGVKFLS